VDDKWQKVPCEASSVYSDSWVVFSAGHPQEASLWMGHDA
jgi:hypothetical protein